MSQPACNMAECWRLLSVAALLHCPRSASARRRGSRPATTAAASSAQVATSRRRRRASEDCEVRIAAVQASIVINARTPPRLAVVGTSTRASAAANNQSPRIRRDPVRPRAASQGALNTAAPAVYSEWPNGSALRMRSAAASGVPASQTGKTRAKSQRQKLVTTNSSINAPTILATSAVRRARPVQIVGASLLAISRLGSSVPRQARDPDPFDSRSGSS